MQDLSEYLPRQAMFFWGILVENMMGKRTKMKTVLKGVSSAFSVVTVVLWTAGW